MVHMGLFISPFLLEVCIQNPMRAVQHLSRLQYHFNDVFVAMVLRRNARVAMKEKDIHVGHMPVIFLK